MTDLISRLAERDPSVPMALAALVRDAAPDGSLDLSTLGVLPGDRQRGACLDG